MGENVNALEINGVHNGCAGKPDDAEQRRREKRRRRRTCFACCGCCAALFILIVMVLVILAFTVFKIKKPQIRLERVTVQDFDAQVILNLPPSVSLNVTLALAVSVHNPNKAAFRYGNTIAFIFYRGVQVGAMPIPAGRLGAGGTATIASSLTLFAGVLLGDIRVYRDFIAGSLPVTATARVSGRVDVFHIFKHHADASTVCNATIAPLNGSGLIKSLDCTYDVNL